MKNFKKHLTKTDILTNFDIEDICSVLRIPLVKIAMRDEVNKLKEGFYILNLDESQNEGTHWTAFIITEDYILYCDSFGMPPPEDVYNSFLSTKKDLLLNQIQYQDVKSVLCGWFAVYFLYCMIYLKVDGVLNKYKRFVAQWDKKNLKNNDRVKAILLSFM